MTLDGFITFLTLLIGGYALTSPVRRMQLRLAARGIVPWSLVAIAGVLYFQFFDLLALPCFANDFGICRALELSTEGPVAPQQAAFLVVMGWLLILLWKLSSYRVRAHDMPALNRLSQQLAEERRFNELLDLLQPWLSLIDECARRERPFQKRRDKLAPSGPAIPLDQIIARLDDGVEAQPTTWTRQLWSRVKSQLGSWLPTGDREEDAARDLLHTLLKQREVVEHICRSRPRFAAHLLSLQTYGVNDFSDRMLEWMIEHPESALYEEVQENQSLRGVAYELSEKNALLHALFKDAALAQKLDVYRPIAESALARLNQANDPAYCRSVNLPHDVLWEERGRWQDSTYITVRFFDIMVRAAASQNIRWHMWLYYMPHFVKWLEKNYADDGEGVDAQAEWPTRSSALLYDIFDTLREWIRLAAKLDENSPHHEPKNEKVDHENGNIPKSAAIALGMCVRTVVLSDRISDRFKQYVLETALRTVNEMPQGSPMAKLRTVTLRSIAEGGVASVGEEYRDRLSDLYEEIHQPWHFELEDFETMIGFGAAT